MLTFGIALLIVGLVCVVLSAVAPVPTPINQLGWIALVVGLILIVLAYILPLATVHPVALGLLASLN